MSTKILSILLIPEAAIMRDTVDSPTLSFCLRDSIRKTHLAPSAPIRDGILQSFLRFLSLLIQKTSMDFLCQHYSTLMTTMQAKKQISSKCIKIRCQTSVKLGRLRMKDTVLELNTKISKCILRFRWHFIYRPKTIALKIRIK